MKASKLKELMVLMLFFQSAYSWDPFGAISDFVNTNVVQPFKAAVVDPIVSAAIVVKEKVIDPAGAAIVSAANQVGSGVIAGANFFKDRVIDPAGAAIVSAANTVKDKLGEAYNTVSSKVVEYSNQVKESFEKLPALSLMLAKNLSDEGQSAWNRLTKGVEPIARRIKDFGELAAREINNNVIIPVGRLSEDAFNKTKELAVEFGNNTKSAFEKFGNEVKAFGEEVVKDGFLEFTQKCQKDWKVCLTSPVEQIMIKGAKKYGSQTDVDRIKFLFSLGRDIAISDIELVVGHDLACKIRPEDDVSCQPDEEEETPAGDEETPAEEVEPELTDAELQKILDEVNAGLDPDVPKLTLEQMRELYKNLNKPDNEVFEDTREAVENLDSISKDHNLTPDELKAINEKAKTNPTSTPEPSRSWTDLGDSETNAYFDNNPTGGWRDNPEGGWRDW